MDEQEQREAYRTGRADGYAGRLDQAQAVNPETGAVYRSGLQDGRAAKIDDDLRQKAQEEGL